jgi:hypothetical protein
VGLRTSLDGCGKPLSHRYSTLRPPSICSEQYRLPAITKGLGREANHLLVPSVEIKKAWNYTPHNSIAKLLVRGRLDCFVALAQRTTLYSTIVRRFNLRIKIEKITVLWDLTSYSLVIGVAGEILTGTPRISVKKITAPRQDRTDFDQHANSFFYPHIHMKRTE